MGERVLLANQDLRLFSEKALWWESRNILLISDMHLGKINHFRKAGIPVPHSPNDENIARLISLLQKVQPDRVLFTGDLFHSYYNTEWEVFGQVLKYFPSISFELIVGNHDIMSDYQYLKHKLQIHREPLIIDQFIFSHEPLEEIPRGAYNFAGHIHPGVVMRGLGRQRVKLPCFYFGAHQGLLPAFGAFTGLCKIKPQSEDKVYVILEDKVLKVNG